MLTMNHDSQNLPAPCAAYRFGDIGQPQGGGLFLEIVMDIEWRKVDGYEGMYEVSSDGQVRSVERLVRHWQGGLSRFGGKQIKPVLTECGYHKVPLSKESKRAAFFVHRLVAIAFIENPLGLAEVNHKNGIKTDNRIENLEWVNRQQNKKHAYDTGITIPKRGVENGISKLTDDIVRVIRSSSENQYVLAARYGVTQAAINNAKHRRTWRHVL